MTTTTRRAKGLAGLVLCIAAQRPAWLARSGRVDITMSVRGLAALGGWGEVAPEPGPAGGVQEDCAEDEDEQGAGGETEANLGHIELKAGSRSIALHSVCLLCGRTSLRDGLSKVASRRRFPTSARAPRVAVHFATSRAHPSSKGPPAGSGFLDSPSARAARVAVHFATSRAYPSRKGPPAGSGFFLVSFAAHRKQRSPQSRIFFADQNGRRSPRNPVISTMVGRGNGGQRDTTMDNCGQLRTEADKNIDIPSPIMRTRPAEPVADLSMADNTPPRRTL